MDQYIHRGDIIVMAENATERQYIKAEADGYVTSVGRVINNRGIMFMDVNEKICTITSHPQLSPFAV